jgi:hypothetical protein
MKASPSKPNATNAIRTICGTKTGGRDISAGLEADVKENVAPMLIDARHRLSRYALDGIISKFFTDHLWAHTKSTDVTIRSSVLALARGSGSVNDRGEAKRN